MIDKRRSFITGIKGTRLSPNEIFFLKKYKPWGVILFSRNIKTISQTQELTSKIKNQTYNYTEDEIKILKKVSEWPRCLDTASNKLEPHRIQVYLYELSSEFH